MDYVRKSYLRLNLRSSRTRHRRFSIVSAPSVAPTKKKGTTSGGMVEEGGRRRDFVNEFL